MGRVAGVPAAFAALAALAAAEPPVVRLNMYAALPSHDVGEPSTVENVDLSDLTGVVQRLHTEIVSESGIRDPDVGSRPGGVDTVARWEFKVRNPASITDDATLARLQDFGPFATFEYGQAAEEQLDEVFEAHGDVVGAQRSSSPLWKTDTVHYDFSLSGFCPNLPWKCTAGFEGCESSSVQAPRCMDTPCPGKGSVKDPENKCLQMNDASDTFLKGGLCSSDDAMERVGYDDMDPTGAPGCVYMFGKQATVSLDELSGITTESCGDHQCENWKDFRDNCENPEYRRKFNPLTMEVEESRHCVEFDIHPTCTGADGCDDAVCAGLTPSERELGLPFWRGRCDRAANQQRVEWLASAFEVRGAVTEHRLVPDALEGLQFDTPCVREGGPLSCTPTPSEGGAYCTRSWSGVCTPCFIPGTKKGYPVSGLPYCPYDVLERVEYAGLEKPECSSKKAGDLCCLYTMDCDGTTDVRYMELNDDGWRRVSATQSTDTVYAFLRRVAEQKMDRVVEDGRALQELAYWLWGSQPLKDVLLSDVQVKMAPAISTGPAHAITKPPRWTTSTTEPLPPSVDHWALSLLPGWAYGLIALAIFSVLVLILCIAVQDRSPQTEQRGVELQNTVTTA